MRIWYDFGKAWCCLLLNIFLLIIFNILIIFNLQSFSLYNSATVITELRLKYVVGDGFKENSQMTGVLLLLCRICFKNIPSTLSF